MSKGLYLELWDLVDILFNAATVTTKTGEVRNHFESEKQPATIKSKAGKPAPFFEPIRFNEKEACQAIPVRLALTPA
jgi:hypothetical protein